MKLTRRTVLITGGTSGIGLEMAGQLLARDNVVIVTGRDDKGIEAAKSRHPALHAYKSDVGDMDEIRRLHADVTARFSQLDTLVNRPIASASEHGRLDLLVNNAAISRPPHAEGLALADHMKTMSATTISLDDMRTIWETNVFAVVAVTQAMLPLLRTAPAARIVNVGSGARSLTPNADSFLSLTQDVLARLCRIEDGDEHRHSVARD